MQRAILVSSVDGYIDALHGLKMGCTSEVEFGWTSVFRAISQLILPAPLKKLEFNQLSRAVSVERPCQ